MLQVREYLLFLHQCYLVRSDGGALNAVRKCETRIDPDLRILGLKVFLYEKLEQKIGYFYSVQ